jgi:hypothetical protein
MPDAHRDTRQEAKDMPNARHALHVLARVGDTWPAHGHDWASTASGGIPMSPALGSGISQTERAMSFRDATHALVTISGVRWLRSGPTDKLFNSVSKGLATVDDHFCLFL